jgi:hypothetical protein
VGNSLVSGVKGVNYGDDVPLENKIQRMEMKFGARWYGGQGLWVVVEVEIEWQVLLK